MYIVTDEILKLSQEIKRYFVNGGIITEAPKEITDKIEKMRKLAKEEEARQIAMMCK